MNAYATALLDLSGDVSCCLFVPLTFREADVSGSHNNHSDVDIAADDLYVGKPFAVVAALPLAE